MTACACGVEAVPEPPSADISTGVGGVGGAAGAAAEPAGAPRFLAHERRGLWGQASYNIGYTYVLGLALGGSYGLVSGLRSAPNATPRVLLNSCLNGTGKFGARAGNAAGVLALLYTLAERQLEDAEVDRLPGAVNNALGRDVFARSRADGVLTAAAAFATGALFALPRAATMRGVDRLHVGPGKRAAVVVLGGLAACAGVGALATASPLIFGERSPFRFA